MEFYTEEIYLIIRVHLFRGIYVHISCIIIIRSYMLYAFNIHIKCKLNPLRKYTCVNISIIYKERENQRD